MGIDAPIWEKNDAEAHFFVDRGSIACYYSNTHRSRVLRTRVDDQRRSKEMDAAEPRVRHRGFFLHVETPELDHAVEQEAAEGVSIRLRVARPRVERSMAGSTRQPTHAIRTTSLSSQTSEAAEKGRPSLALRLATATGSHRQARMSR